MKSLLERIDLIINEEWNPDDAGNGYRKVKNAGKYATGEEVMVGDTVKVKKTGWVGKISNILQHPKSGMGPIWVVDFGATTETYSPQLLTFVRRKK